ncbi:DsbA family protein [Candidatus Lariskella endosymbiont of Hedychridium roseum]|uniref:DsbA family protein n=1 Tax=Candidatus Lariskella endosymbiont of Hedychridium roseum TaxID=3077949 RepID=UPI0030D2723F
MLKLLKQILIENSMLKPVSLLSILSLLNFVTICYADSNNSASTKQSIAKEEKLPTKDDVLAIDENDIIIGDVDAPVTVFEYSSLACPHCATFHKENFEKLKAEYIDKKIVRYVHRDFPNTRPALMGSVLARCSGQYEKYINILFNSQMHWAYSQDYQERLRGIAKLGGMDNKQIDNCLSDNQISERILRSNLYASRVLNINGTPAFVINGEVLEGSKYSKIKAAIDKAFDASKTSPASQP